MFTFLYDKFTQDNVYQILSESVEFYKRDDKKHFGVLLVHSVFSFYIWIFIIMPFIKVPLGLPEESGPQVQDTLTRHFQEQQQAVFL